MTGAVGPGQVERFRTFLAARMGLQFEDARLGWLGDILRRHADAGRVTIELCLRQLESSAARNDLRALAQEITVGETYFLRNIDQFRALREHVLPERLRTQAGQRRLRILSAGCASGEEAYSIAMTLHELQIPSSWELTIRAVDLNPAAIEKARRGRYTPWALRETPPTVQQRWFRPDAGELAIDNSLRQAVSFEERNLSEDDPQLWQAGAYDVVFCRNVLMYFTPRSAQATVARITRSLAPGGYLFLGHAETLRGVSQDFHLLHTHGTFYYQRKSGVEQEAGAKAPLIAPATAFEGPALAAAIDDADTWVEAIGRAAERVRLLTAQTQDSTSRRTAAGATESWQLGQALELLRHERFADALDLMRALPPGATRDPEVLLLRAVLLVNHGDLAQAEDTCHRLLAVDELNAGAHYVLALCREGMGDRRGARGSDMAAVYLDPAFAMPHLHLGLLARRAGDREAQQRELSEALALLQREDASRLVLFGGGFSREALLALCRAELLAVGTAP